MRAIFAHDHIFYHSNVNNKVYSTGGLSKKMLERYTKHFSHLNVVSRQTELKEKTKKLTLASTDNVTFIKVPNFKSLKNYKKILKARKIIYEEVKDCDVLIARLPSSIGGIAIKAARKYNRPYLVEMVACPWDALWNHSLTGKIIAPFSYYKTKQLIKDAPYVIYVTNEFLQKRYPNTRKRINCSNVALTDFDESILNKRIKKIEGLSKDNKIIIGTTAAVNVRYKGQQYIIEALGKLKKQGYTNYEYQLVGDGDQRYLESVAEKFNVSNQVKFLGAMQHDEVFNWLDTIDIYTQPSRQEGLPRALIEAMSRGLPAFGARTAGIPELLEPKFIFSNSRNNVQEICNLLKNFEPKVMKTQSVRNFNEAKKYQHFVLEQRRSNFFTLFKNDVLNTSNE